MENQRFSIRKVVYVSVVRSSYFAWLKRLFLCSPCELARRTYSLTVHRTLCGAPVPLHGLESVVSRSSVGGYQAIEYIVYLTYIYHISNVFEEG